MSILVLLSLHVLGGLQLKAGVVNEESPGATGLTHPGSSKKVPSNFCVEKTSGTFWKNWPPVCSAEETIRIKHTQWFVCGRKRFRVTWQTKLLVRVPPDTSGYVNRGELNIHKSETSSFLPGESPVDPLQLGLVYPLSPSIRQRLRAHVAQFLSSNHRLLHS